MTDENYTVKINRRDGALEISGADKAWIAEQLDKLAMVYIAEPSSSDGGTIEEPNNDNGETGTKTARRGRKARVGGGSSRAKKKDPSPVMEQLSPAARKKLETFVADRSFKGTQKQAAIIATFLEDELKFDGIDQDDLAAVYEIMGWKAPVNPRAVINNARTRDKFFRGWVNGKTHLSVAGQNFGRIDSKKNGGAES